MANQAPDVYKELCKVSVEYFGPATDRFLTAQIKHHLHKEPSELKRTDIPELVDWLALTLAHVTSDTEQIKQYIDRVRKLSRR
jgi:hypothetical protein